MNTKDQKELDEVLQIVMPDEYYQDMRKLLMPHLIKWHETKVKNITSNVPVLNRYSITLRQIAEIKDAGESMRAMMGNGEPEAEECFGRHVKWINAMLKRNGFKVIE